MTDQAAPAAPAPAVPAPAAPSTVATIETVAVSAAKAVEAKAAGLWATVWAAIKPSMAQAIAGIVLALLGVGVGMGAQTFRQAAAPAPKPVLVVRGSTEDLKPALDGIKGDTERLLREGPQWHDAPKQPVAAPPAAKPRPRAAKSTTWF